MTEQEENMLQNESVTNSDEIAQIYNVESGSSNENLPEPSGTPGDLQPISVEDQRRIQLKGNQPLQPPESGTPEGRFETRIRGEVVGSSAVDLSIPENRELMKQEERAWFHMPLGPERDALEDAWYQTYYGKTAKEVNDRRSGFMYGGNTGSLYGDVGAIGQQVMQRMSAVGVGIPDFVMDGVGSIPGLGFIDNAYDRTTRFSDDFAQGLRKFSSIVLPSMFTGGALATKLPAITAGMPAWKAWLTGTALWSAQETAIIGISDVGEEENLLATVADTFPGIFGPKGYLPVPGWARTNPGDSVKVKEYKNMLDTAGLSIFGSILGMTLKLKGGGKTLQWMEPLDEVADNYKASQVVLNTDQARLDRMYDINETLANETLDRITEKELINELETLKGQLDNVPNIEEALDLIDSQRKEAQGILGDMKTASKGANDLNYDPDQFPFGPEETRAVQTPEPGAVGKNMGDTTLIKVTGQEGDPANILTPSIIRKGLGLGPGITRNAIMGIAKEAEDLGRFKYLSEGFRFSQKQMNSVAWDIYQSIIAADSMEQMRDIFLDNRDVKNMLLGKFKVAYINEEQARGAAFAMRDLVDRFLGRKVTEASARAMDTLGREATTMSRAFTELSNLVDDPRATELIIDKIQFLMDEYALNKYIAGWSLRNKNYFRDVLPENLEAAVDTLRREFLTAEKSIAAKNKAFSETIKELAATNPLALRPLMDAFSYTNGDVDTIAKLMQWAANQITPVGMLKSPDPRKLNMFAKGTFMVVYNNLLSGISAFTATLGNTSQLMLRPITDILGHGIWGAADNFEGLKGAMYYHGAMYETNKRALVQSWRAMRRAWKDPDTMLENMTRPDFQFKIKAEDEQIFNILEDSRALWEKEGNWGRLLQLDYSQNMKALGEWNFARYGMIGMVAPDKFADIHTAHLLSRIMAYDDVFSEFGFADWKKIFVAEKKHYARFFDKNNNLTDDAVRAISGELKLTNKDGVADWLNQATTAYPITKHLFMFPRTSSNWVKTSLSWTPIQAIPGINKYSKTIWARTEGDIIQALAEHGIDYSKTPNAMAIFRHLRAEYTGRMAFSSLLTKGLWDYAMAGNIRGNGHYNKSRRYKERDNLKYIPKTIKFPIPGKDNDVWVSYKGIPGVEQVLSVLGDLAYYAGDLDETFVENIQSKLMWTLSASFIADTPFAQLQPLVEAANGNIKGWNNFLANTALSYAPAVGLARTVRNAIDSAQKEIQGEIHEFVANRLPPFNYLLPDKIDIWTGQPVNDLEHPVLKALNAVSPIKIHPGVEPWRQWLQNMGYNGHTKITRSSTGVEYSPDQRELIVKYIGQQQPWKEVQKMMNSKRWANEVGLLRAHRATGGDDTNERIKLKAKNLPIFKEIDRILKNAQVNAELRLLNENKDIGLTSTYDKIVRHAEKRGDVLGARAAQERHKQLQQLLQMAK